MRKIWRWYISMSFMVKMTGGFLIGILLGIVLGEHSSFLAPLGTLFLNLLKMIVIPLVIFSLMVAVNHSNPKELGRIGYFLVYTNFGKEIKSYEFLKNLC